MGACLGKVCQELGGRQLVHEPTRGSYLLDVVITDLEHANSTVVPGLSGTQSMATAIAASVPTVAAMERVVWNYRDADWDLLQDHVSG